MKVRMQRYLFQDKYSNEIFLVTSSFAIPRQVICADSRYYLAKLEYALGGKMTAEERFNYLGNNSEEEWTIFEDRKVGNERL